MRGGARHRRIAWVARGVCPVLLRERLVAEAEELEGLALRLSEARDVDEVRAALETELPDDVAEDVSEVWQSRLRNGCDELVAARELASILMRWARRHRRPDSKRNAVFSRRVLNHALQPVSRRRVSVGVNRSRSTPRSTRDRRARRSASRRRRRPAPRDPDAAHCGSSRHLHGFASAAEVRR
jgi:hypothetical protein